jgi:hypothetical protein
MVLEEILVAKHKMLCSVADIFKSKEPFIRKNKQTDGT